MPERKKTNLQHLKDLTETLCDLPDYQCGKCQKLGSDSTCQMNSGITELNSEIKAKIHDIKKVLEAIKAVAEECISLKSEITALKEQINLMLKENGEKLCQ